MIEFSVDMTPLETKLNSMTTRMEHPPMREVGGVIVESTAKTFAAGGRPEAWITNKLGTPTLGGPRSSLVKNTLITGVGELFVEVTGGAGLIYSRVHQLGATITAKNAPYLKFKMGDRWVQKKSVTIPARRWFRVQDEDLNTIVSLLKNYILQGERA